MNNQLDKLIVALTFLTGILFTGAVVTLVRVIKNVWVP